MRAMTQRIKKQDVQVAELRHRIFWNLTEIGEIGGASKAVAVYLSLAVQELDGKKVRSKQSQFAIQGKQLDARQRGVIEIGFKNVVK